jgi:hypothetical protein
MLPGVSPGKNTPVVNDFLDDISKLEKYDEFNTLTKEKTMTEKVAELSKNMCYTCDLFHFSQNLFRILK